MTPSEQAAAALKAMRNPAYSLLKFGKVMDQVSDMPIAFDPTAITYDMQSTILAYASEPPRDENGFTKFFALLGSRQTGKSTTADSAFYPKAAYHPGWEHQTYADTQWRADYLHGRLQYLHAHWPEEMRSPTRSAVEKRQLTFHPNVGGSMVTRSLEARASGIGQSPNSVHVSEVPFANYAAEQWTYLQPAVINKMDVRVLFEATPAPSDQPSVDFWKETCYDAKMGMGRWVYGFFPFWDGKLNVRPWPKDWRPDNEEVELLQKYGPAGLKLEHLAFRRMTIETDKHLRRNPDLFKVWYPFDDVTCWTGTSKTIIRRDLIEKQQKRVLVPWGKNTVYKEYKPVHADGQYGIGVDPTGFAARDHASFQVLECWDNDWEQVACYATHIGDPEAFTNELIRVARRYNDAWICVEETGVGVGVLALLKAKGYRRIYYTSRKRPGFIASAKSNEQALAWLVDALMDCLKLNDEDTVDQLGTYQNDKLVEESARGEQLRKGRRMRGRRPRHHWDKISALIMAVVQARRLRTRFRPGMEDGPDNVLQFRELTADQIEDYHKEVKAAKAELTGGARKKYKSVRRKRR